MIGARTRAIRQATVLPMYKPSTRKNHRHVVQKHLLARFGARAVADITRQEVQAYVAHLNRRGTRARQSITSTTSSAGASFADALTDSQARPGRRVSFVSHLTRLEEERRDPEHAKTGAF